MNRSLVNRRTRQSVLVWGLKHCISITLATMFLGSCNHKTSSIQPDFSSEKSVAPSTAVGCIGHIAPDEGTYLVSPHLIGATGPVIESIQVKAGDEVKAGQVIATLSSRQDLESAVRLAEAQLALANARRVRVKAISSRQEISVAQAEISRLQAEKDVAVHDYERDKTLFEKDFISRKQIEAETSRVRESEALLAQALAKAEMTVEARPEDIKIADAQVQVAQADLLRAKRDVASSIVRAPSRARVLQVFGHPGETVSQNGIAELANTDVMVIIAEVYEADIPRVHLGQKAIITSELYSNPLIGSVAYISPQIEQQERGLLEAGSPTDARVFKVRIKVGNDAHLDDKINGKVKVVIQP